MDTDTDTPRRSRFRFSLREAMIAIVAICAVVALFMKSRPHSPTDFLLTIDERTLITQSCRAANLALQFGGTSVGVRGASNGGSSRESSLMLQSPPIEAFEAQVMPELQKRTEQLLRKAGCEIMDHAQGGTKEFERLQQFSFRYRQGVTRGVVRVFSFEYPSGEVRVMFLIDEW